MPINALTIFQKLIQWLEKHYYCGAFTLGIITALSLPPIGIFFALLISLPLILHLTYQAEKKRHVVFIGFLFALGYFFFGLYWTTAAFYLLLREIIWLLPVSLIGLPIALALFWVPAFLAAHFTRHVPTLSILIFITLLTWGEYLRGHFILNFSWNLMGYGLYKIPQFLQITSVAGIYGLNFFFFALASIPFLIWKINNKKLSQILLGIILLVTMIIFSWGHFRFQSDSREENKSVAIQIIHPNISQIEKLESHSDTALIQKYIDLTKDKGQIKAPNMISIWPENTISLYQNRSDIPLQTLGKNLPDNSHIILGAERIFPHEHGKTESFNSLIVLNKNGNIIADYNKHILAPFGESFPYESLSRQTIFHTILKDKSFLTAGDGARTLKIANLPTFSPQICYEAAYAGYTPRGKDRPQFIVVTSNDNWADFTTQPYQAFVQTQVRAIEEGLPILRAANKGISAIIDPYGRVLQSLNTNEAGTLNGYLPNTIPPTFYARYGDTPFLIFMSAFSAILGIAWFIKRRL